MPVRMTRRKTFSSGHRFWLNQHDLAGNRSLYGLRASPFNHGHNYVLEVSVEGEVDPSTGMVVNIKRVDDVLRERVIERFDGKSINDEIEWFAERTPSVENLLGYICDELLEHGENRLFRVSRTIGGAEDASVALVGLKLAETATFYGELDLLHDSITLTRSYEFAASHRLHAVGLSESENKALYGKCNNAAGHGHNYVLEVTVGGEVDPRTGMLVNLDALDSAVRALVVDRYDHRNLDVDVPELAGQITTSEIVAGAIFRALEGNLPAELERVRLYETARNMFEVSRHTQTRPARSALP